MDKPMKRLVYLVAIVSLLAGCREGSIFTCDRDSARARAKGQDPRLYGIWYSVEDQREVEAGNTDEITMKMYSPGGYYDWGSKQHLRVGGYGVWYTKGDTIHYGKCWDSQFRMHSSIRYRVHKDTLWLSNIDKQIDPESPGEHFYLRLDE